MKRADNFSSLRPGRAFCCLLLASLCMLGRDAGAGVEPGALRQAMQSICSADEPALRPVDRVLRALGGGIELSNSTLSAPAAVTARRYQLMLPDGARLRLDLHRRGDSLAQVIVEISERIGARRQPVMWVVADGACRMRVARRIEYNDNDQAAAVTVLADDLVQVRSRELLDAEVPPRANNPGVMVAMVDSGVNYNLPALNERLARDARGNLIGFDWWDMEPRPFDSHPSRSAFLPRRHGTRTASVLLADAPMARIAPMRYPRPDMSRMLQLVDAVDGHGIKIVNLSLGGNDAAQWAHFEQAARAHPHILFVVSAGNNERDLDTQPVFPAALTMPNLITVGSSDAQSLPAPGSNWGRRSVHLLVPAERLVAMRFSGYAARVSGSSYAAARVSALAACFLAAHPQWQAPQLKSAIFELARQPVHESMAFVAVGVLPEPRSITRGVCAAEPSSVMQLGTLQLDEKAIYPDSPMYTAHQNRPQTGVAFKHELVPLTLLWIEDAGWEMETLISAVAGAARIYRQCGVRFTGVSIRLIRAPREMHYHDTRNAIALTNAVSPSAPAAWFMRDSLQQPSFDAQAIGRSNTPRGSGLANTLWMTSHLEHPAVALAHELYHILANTGAHVPEKGNLMNLNTSPGGTKLWDWQCDRLIKTATAFELIKPAPKH
jgi:hypothetical protein